MFKFIKKFMEPENEFISDWSKESDEEIKPKKVEKSPLIPSFGAGCSGTIPTNYLAKQIIYGSGTTVNISPYRGGCSG